MDRQAKKNTAKRTLERQTPSNDNSRGSSPSRDFAANPELYSTDGGISLSRKKTKRLRTNTSLPSTADIPSSLNHPPFSDIPSRESYPRREAPPPTTNSFSHPERPRETSFTHALSHEPYLTVSYSEDGTLDENSLKSLKEEISKHQKDIHNILLKEGIEQHTALLQANIKEVIELARTKVEYTEKIYEKFRTFYYERTNKDRKTDEEINKMRLNIENEDNLITN